MTPLFTSQPRSCTSAETPGILCVLLSWAVLAQKGLFTSLDDIPPLWSQPQELCSERFLGADIPKSQAKASCNTLGQGLAKDDLGPNPSSRLFVYSLSSKNSFHILK